ncbi:hypothetical protein KIS4809_1823 [Bacillus sp. ZZV12-4809]|nr:hypothetical protein KIS4809_1823 [Bacillus sp. ZZV12-4809]
MLTHFLRVVFIRRSLFNVLRVFMALKHGSKMLTARSAKCEHLE